MRSIPRAPGATIWSSARPSWRSPARSSEIPRTARWLRAGERVGPRLPRRGGRRGHAQPLRHERARPRRSRARAAGGARGRGPAEPGCSTTCARSWSAASGARGPIPSPPARSTTTSTPRRTPSGWSPPPCSTARSRTTAAFDAFATSQRDWALGANAWGESLMIGVGQQFPRCPQHVVANLSGQAGRQAARARRRRRQRAERRQPVRRRPRRLLLERPRLPAACAATALKAFSGHGSRFVDDVSAWQTVEPAIDFDAAAALAFALSAS